MVVCLLIGGQCAARLTGRRARRRHVRALSFALGDESACGCSLAEVSLAWDVPLPVVGVVPYPAV
jgi:hypothetical protein